MKKIISIGCILTIVLFFFPLNSMAKGSKRGKDSQDPLVCPNEGNIEGLEFDFGKGFPLDLGLGFTVTITHVDVEASGQELTVIIPPKEYIYNADLSGGWQPEDGSDEWDSDHGSNGRNSENGSDGWDSDHGNIFADATVDLGKKKGSVMEVTLTFQFDSATIFERFNIKKKDMPAKCPIPLDVTVPKKVNLYFEVINAQLIRVDGLANPSDATPLNLAFLSEVPPLNLVLIIDKGKLTLVQTFEVNSN